MTKTSTLLSMILALSLFCTFVFCEEAKPAEEKEYRSPEYFEKDIQAFEEADKLQAPPAGAIVCIGSSSMKGWHKTIHEDLAPLTVIPRGFGGSNMNDALHFADRIVIPYKPRAIVLYEGDNDVAQGISPEKIRDTFLKFVEKIHEALPETRIYFLSIKPSGSRWHIWPQMQEANSLIAGECAKSRLLTYIDVAAGMFDSEGSLKEDIFLGDRLHMNSKGYVIWKDIARPILIENELTFEKKEE